jgi:retinoid hydroxylase
MINFLSLEESSIPGDPYLPLLGQTLDFYYVREKFFWEQYQRYGDVFRINVMGRQAAVLVGPEANEFILKNRDNAFSMREGWFFLESLLGGGLFQQEGSEHIRARRLIFPTFHGDVLEGYSQIICKTIDKLLDSWSRSPTLNLISELHRLTLAIACQIILGVETEEDITLLSQYFSDLFQGIETVLKLDLPFMKFGIAKASRRRIEKFILSKIEKKRSNPASSTKNDVISLLIDAIDEDGSSLSDNEIVDHAIQLLFAGHESTSLFLFWSLFSLDLYPEWKQIIHSEILEKSQGSPLEQLKLQTNLNYFTMEVERLYGPSYFLPRGIIKDCEYQGYKLPRGWLVMTSPMLTHRLPSIFSNPFKFDPLRFASPREEHKKHPFALIGFGGGAHHCLGKELAKMEVSLLISHLVRDYNWKLDPTPKSFSNPGYKEHTIEHQVTFSVSKVAKI